MFKSFGVVVRGCCHDIAMQHCYATVHTPHNIFSGAMRNYFITCISNSKIFVFGLCFLQ